MNLDDLIVENAESNRPNQPFPTYYYYQHLSTLHHPRSWPKSGQHSWEVFLWSRGDFGLSERPMPSRAIHAGPLGPPLRCRPALLEKRAAGPSQNDTREISDEQPKTDKVGGRRQRKGGMPNHEGEILPGPDASDDHEESIAARFRARKRRGKPIGRGVGSDRGRQARQRRDVSVNNAGTSKDDNAAFLVIDVMHLVSGS